MKEINKKQVAASIIILVAVGISYLILRETPEKCVQREFLEWRELNKKAFLNQPPSSDNDNDIVFPPYDLKIPGEVTARVKSIAKTSTSNLSSKARQIVESSRIILDVCGVRY